MKRLDLPMQQYLSPEALRILREIGEVAGSLGEDAYLVGGALRDMLMKRPAKDIDVVVAGNAIFLARHIAQARHLQVETHPRFGTATLHWEALDIDIVTARSEVYDRPGALPLVKSGTIADDLRRRDFSINAMAIRLNPESFGELLDPHDGQGDLERQLIRVLHQGSFEDDPTRILRAIRYEQRLAFSLEKQTESWLRQGLNTLETVSPQRRWRELELILKEGFPEDALHRADELGVLDRLCPAMRGDDWLKDKCAQARVAGDETLSFPSVYLSILAWRMSGVETVDCMDRLKMPGWAARVLKDTVSIRPVLDLLEVTQMPSSRVYRQLRKHLPEVIWAAWVVVESTIVRDRLELYLDRLRKVATVLTGEDLLQMGVPSGEGVGRMLRALHDARLDQEIDSRDQEIELVERRLRRSSP